MANDGLAEHLGIDERAFVGLSPCAVFMLGVEYASWTGIAADPAAIKFELGVSVHNLDRVLSLLRGRGWVVLSDVPKHGLAILYGWKGATPDGV